MAFLLQRRTFIGWALLAWSMLACACSPGDFDKLGSGVSASDAGLDAGGRGGSSGGKSAARAGASGDSGAGGAGTGAAGERPRGDGGAGSIAADGGKDGGSPGSGPAGAGGSATGGAAGGGGDPGPSCGPLADLGSVHATATELGMIQKPAWIESRSAHLSLMLGDRMLWVFGVPNDQYQAVWGDPRDLLATPPRFDGMPVTPSLFPSGAVPSGSTIALGSAVALDDSEAWLYFADASFFTAGEVGLARIARDGTEATLVRASGQLYARAPAADGGTANWNAPFMSGAMLDDQTPERLLYVYGCQAKPNTPDEMTGGARENPCRLARVPATDIGDGASYRFWSGTEWVAESDRAAIVLDHAGSGLSVARNRYLDRYLMARSTGINMIALHWAPRPEGPWTMLAQLTTLPSNAQFNTTYGTFQIGVLSDACQKSIYLAYVRPFKSDPAGDAYELENRLVRVDLE